jgi:hypothetical protein
MSYDHKKLSEVLENKEQAIQLAEFFLKQMKEEIINNDEQSYADILEIICNHLIPEQFNLVWQIAESAIERIFISSLMMNFIRNHIPLDLFITPSMQNATKNMDEVRKSIADMKRFVQWHKENQGSDDFIVMTEFLEKSGKKAGLKKEEIRFNKRYLFHYHLLSLSDSIHLTPQASFPKALPNGTGMRVDLMLWVPDIEQFKLIIECDSYQYHDNKDTFDRDRKRSRYLQRKGYKVLQYSGGEIFRDPIRTSSELFDIIMDEYERVNKKINKNSL